MGVLRKDLPTDRPQRPRLPGPGRMPDLTRIGDNPSHPIRVFDEVITSATRALDGTLIRWFFYSYLSTSTNRGTSVSMRLGPTGEFFPVWRGFGLKTSPYRELSIQVVGARRVHLLYGSDPDIDLRALGMIVNTETLGGSL